MAQGGETNRPGEASRAVAFAPRSRSHNSTSSKNAEARQPNQGEGSDLDMDEDDSVGGGSSCTHATVAESAATAATATTATASASASFYWYSKDPAGKTTGRRKWAGPYVPEPVLTQSFVLGTGLLAFVLALVWPPLLLLAAYLASKIVPYSYRTNDDATVRRRLYREYTTADPDSDEDLHPPLLICPPDNIRVEESYWVNERYVPFLVLCMGAIAVLGRAR
jgi:hypothetical protein